MSQKHYWILGICSGVALAVILTVYFSGNTISAESIKQEVSFPDPEEIADPEVSLIAVGDIMLSRDVAAKINKYQDYNYPFLKTADLLKGADLTFGNLETPITPGRKISTGEMVFRSDPEVTEGLTYAGFDILSLANNHILNFGDGGLSDTFWYLKEAKIDFVGAGDSFTDAYQYAIKEVKGIKFAFLAYSYAATANSKVASMDFEKMEHGVAEAAEKADLVIVSMHDSIEYQFFPSNHQKEFAHRAIEAGATLVVGHHPHVVQTAEQYQNGFIIYSLGNFVFDQMWSQETKEGMIAEILFDSSGIKNIQFYPVIIEDFAQPRPASNAEAERIIKRINLDLDKDENSQIPSYYFQYTNNIQ